MSYTRQEVDALLENLRLRAWTFLQDCLNKGQHFSLRALTDAVPLHAPDEPKPAVAWGPPPTDEEALAHAESHHLTEDAGMPVRGRWLVSFGSQPESVMILALRRTPPEWMRDGKFIPLDSDGLPCARHVVTR